MNSLTFKRLGAVLRLVWEMLTNLIVRHFKLAVCKSNARLDGKVVVITGASAGIGEAAARLLAERGAKIIMACRDMKKAENCIQEIKSKVPRAQLSVVQVELSSLDSVRRCAEELASQPDPIDILVNNAGIYTNSEEKTADGYEPHFGVNYLSHFLLTVLLLKKIKQSNNGKIINVSSLAHRLAMLNVGDLPIVQRAESSLMAYGFSKLLQVLFTRELAARYPTIKAYCVHPGLVQTEIGRKKKQPNGVIGTAIEYAIMKTAEEGAQTILHCILDPTAHNESGLYYANCGAASVSKEAMSSEKARQLWEKSMKIVRLEDSDIP